MPTPVYDTLASDTAASISIPVQNLPSKQIEDESEEHHYYECSVTFSDDVPFEQKIFRGVYAGSSSKAAEKFLIADLIRDKNVQNISNNFDMQKFEKLPPKQYLDTLLGKIRYQKKKSVLPAIPAMRVFASVKGEKVNPDLQAQHPVNLPESNFITPDTPDLVGETISATIALGDYDMKEVKKKRSMSQGLRYHN